MASDPAPDSPSPDVADADVVGHDPDPLVALAYVSTPTTDFSDRDIVDLLFASRRWNAHYGITGRLVVLEEDDRVAQFYQWIEGPEAALDACFARITADPRHDQIDIRFRGRVEGRRFPGWDMGIHKTGAADFEAEVNATPGEG